MTLLLCGCTDQDWDRAVSYVGIEHPNAVAQPNSPAEPMPVETASAVPPAYAPPAQLGGPPPADEPQQMASTMPVQPTVVTAQAAVSAADSYCRGIARNTSEISAKDGFDAAAQQAAADGSYRQCMAFYGPQ